MGKSIRKLAVVGAGTMGAAIAACGARAGLDVILMVRGKAEQSGRDRAQKAVADILKSGEMKGSDEARIRAGVVCADMLQDAALLSDCDLVIEAVAENLAQRLGRDDRRYEHLEYFDRLDRGGNGGGTQAPFPRHSLLQPGALYGSRRAHSQRRDGR